LRLRHAPVGEIEVRVVAAGNPGFAADAEIVGELAPRLGPLLGAAADRVEPPQRLAGGGVVAADPAAIVAVAIAADQAVDDNALYHHRSGRVGVPFRAIGDG